MNLTYHLEFFIHLPQDHQLKNKFETIDSKFATSYDAVEEELKSSTVGLMTLEEMKEKRDILVKEREKQMAAQLPQQDR